MVNIGYLLRLEDAVNANITPIQRDGRQAQRGKRCIMVSELTSISMQYHLIISHLNNAW